MVKLNADMKDGTDADTVTDVQVNHVSQTIAKPVVVRSFFVLTYAGQFMDSNLLSSGLYATDIPKLFSKDTSIELLIQQGKTITDMMGNEFIPSSYFDNLAKCKLTEVVVSFAE